jgi:hypothetical protein
MTLPPIYDFSGSNVGAKMHLSYDKLKHMLMTDEYGHKVHLSNFTSDKFACGHFMGTFIRVHHRS